MSLSVAQESAVAVVLEDLDSLLMRAWGALATTFDSSTRAAVEKNLNDDFLRLELLRGRYLDECRAGTRSFAKWADFAQVIGSDIAAQSGAVWSLLDILGGTAAGTYSDVKAGLNHAAAVVEKGAGGFGVGLGLLVGLFILVKLS